MFKHLSSLLVIGLPAALFVVSTVSGCSLVLDEDGVWSKSGELPCSTDDDCDPNYRCRNDLCFHRSEKIPCVDADNDGYGVGEVTDLEECPKSQVEADFDDTCTDCFPGATEVCDGNDNDGDTMVDESVTCEMFIDCPQVNIPGAQARCEGNFCIVAPARYTGECKVTIPCVGGAYDTSSVPAGCLD